MDALSPASSPRLPSPPPIAEDQIGPQSPGVSLYEDHANSAGVSSVDTGASRRIRPGTKAEDMAEGPPLAELQDLDSAFQLTEHLKALHYSHTHPPNTNTLQPITASIARQLSTPPPNTNRDIWLYELGRFLTQKTNAIIVALFADSPPCSAQTCPEMRASEWQYLCAVHDPPKSCSAIDYCCHTLDWAATTLTSSKMFPSRLGLGSGSGASGGSDKVLQQQMKEIKNIFRRVYRIYAHAWFQHREMFWRVEGKTGLYIFFKMVCDEYGIIEIENYTIPAEAEGLEPEPEQGKGAQQQQQQQVPSLLRRDQDSVSGVLAGKDEKHDLAGNQIFSMGDTTKRHRHTVSASQNSVTNAIQEEAEEEAEEEDESGQPPPQPQAEEKPSLDRQATSFRDFAEEPIAEKPTEPGQGSSEDGESAAPGIKRADTIKTIKEEPADEQVEEGEQTVIEASDADKTAVKEDSSEEPKVEVKEVQEEPAGDGDDAGESVED